MKLGTTKSLILIASGAVVTAITDVLLILLNEFGIIHVNENVFKLILSVPFVVYIIFAIIVGILMWKYVDKTYKEEENEVKEKLTSEFQEVFVKNTLTISKERFKCEAKIDENGKIVCNIHTDFQCTFENYQDFMSNFSVNKKHE